MCNVRCRPERKMPIPPTSLCIAGCIYRRSSPDLRQNVVAAIGELMTELKDMKGIIKEHAKDTIHAKYVVLITPV